MNYRIRKQRQLPKPYQQIVNELKEINYRLEYDIQQQGHKYPEPKAYAKFLMDVKRMHLHEKFRELVDNEILDE